MFNLISLIVLAPLFLAIYGLIVFFDLVGTVIGYLLIGGGIFLSLSLIIKVLHFTFSTILGKIGEVIISIILIIPILTVSLSIVGVIAVIIIALLAFPFIFIVGALDISWEILFSIIAGIISIICLFAWYGSTRGK